MPESFALVSIPKPLSAALKDQLQQTRAELGVEIDQVGPADGRGLCLKMTEAVDRVLIAVTEAALSLIQEAFGASAQSVARRVALVALGSYGRQEICPYSDVDLMFLKPPGLSEAQETVIARYVETVLYGLWDLGLDLGHAVRDLEECRVAAEDQSVLTGLLDARLIAGEPESARYALFMELQESLQRLLFQEGGAQRLIAAKLAEAEERRARFGSSVFLLEPNLKDGQGGLRELHTALWVARLTWRVERPSQLVRLQKLSERECRALERAYRYVLGLRVLLHLEARRKQDVLRFQHQESMAVRLGLVRPPTDDLDRRHQGTERLMRAYYFQAQTMTHLAALVVERAGLRPLSEDEGRRVDRRSGFRIQDGALTVEDRQQFTRDPSDLVRIFRVAQREKLGIYSYTKTLISASRQLIGPKERRSKAAVLELFRVLEAEDSDLDTLEAMHSLGVLRQMIPEFSRVSSRWQHSLYHVYTVDAHSLVVLQKLRELASGRIDRVNSRIQGLFQDLGRKRVLFVAGLIHDLGKGWPKLDHSIKGAELARGIGQRFEEAGLASWTAAETEDLAWLIQEHLSMSSISQRRDVSDPELLESFSANVKTRERLSMLYLLTIADMMGTSPKVWTEWKGSLLEELYENTRQTLLERGPSPRDHAHRLERRRRIREEMLGVPPGGLSLEEIDQFLDSVGDRYLFSNHPVRMVRHIQMWKKVSLSRDIAVKVQHLRSEGTNRITLASPDRPGLLSWVSGTLTAAGMQVLSANVYSAQGYKAPGDTAPLPSVAIDVLMVRGEGDQMVTDRSRWRRIRRDLRRVILQGASVEALVQDRLRYQKIRAPHEPGVKAKVAILNEESATETVIDIFGRDRPGILYRITEALFRLGLSIALARISTQGRRVADGFYVTDAQSGDKLTDPARLEAVKAALLKVMAGEEPEKA